MEGLLAIFGDVHSNIEALEAVLEDARREGATEYLCTGDVVGYNAAPHECLKRVRELNCPVVKGNHDHYISYTGLDLADFHPDAAAVVRWTRERLDVEELEFLRQLPFTCVRKGITLVHATLDNPEGFGYVFDHLQAEASFIMQRTPVCFHGHTHCPIVYERQLGGVFMIDPSELGEREFTLPSARRYFVNVGAVGQPRDGNWRASYALYDLGKRTVRFRRVAYDVAAAQARIRAAGLPERLALRLGEGK